jgi:hypothetical protein
VFRLSSGKFQYICRFPKLIQIFLLPETNFTFGDMRNLVEPDGNLHSGGSFEGAVSDHA